MCAPFRCKVFTVADRDACTPFAGPRLVREDPGGFDIGNRFSQWVIPALREVMAGKAQEEVDVPSLVDGWRVQLFTDAVLESSRRGAWVDLAEMNKV